MTLKDYFQKTKKEKWAIGQFNFSTIEQLRAILEAGKELKSPLILGTSEGEVEFLGIKEVIALVEISKEFRSWKKFRVDQKSNRFWI